jgi:hypothetical protein
MANTGERVKHNLFSSKAGIDPSYADAGKVKTQ